MNRRSNKLWPPHQPPHTSMRRELPLRLISSHHAYFALIFQFTVVKHFSQFSSLFQRRLISNSIRLQLNISLKWETNKSQILIRKVIIIIVVVIFIFRNVKCVLHSHWQLVPLPAAKSTEQSMYHLLIPRSNPRQ